MLKNPEGGSLPVVEVCSVKRLEALGAFPPLAQFDTFYMY